ncbi:gliding motility associated protien GldN [bacterium A37T11]|nr:gliding motility associated protien GldN [bacterium A37T11]
MKRINVKIFLVAITFTMVMGRIQAQEPDSMLVDTTVLDTIPTGDGYYQAIDLMNNKPMPLPKLAMTNIRFYKRVYRDVDLKDEKNEVLSNPNTSLMAAIMDDLKKGKLSAYEDNAFKKRLSAPAAEARFTDSVLVPEFDDDGNQINSHMELNEFNPEKVTRYRLKEDIFQDKIKGTIETRIIGVAPLMEIAGTEGVAGFSGAVPAFWLYYPQLRYTMAHIDISNQEEGLLDLTMDDLFLQRKFAGTIVPEYKNLTDTAAIDTTGLAQNPQIDSDETEEKIASWKKDLWKYPNGVDSSKVVAPAPAGSKRLKKVKSKRD